LNSAHRRIRIRRRIRVKTVADAEKFLSKIIRKFQGGEIDRQDAKDWAFFNRFIKYS
jgi:hypothetical protein